MAILATEELPWVEIERRGQNATWKSNRMENIQVVRYTSEQKKNYQYFASEILWKITRLEKLIKLNLFGVVKNFWNKYLNRLSPKIDRIESTVLIHLPEAYSLIGLKTIIFLEYVLKNYEFEYLYRTNVSSYVDLGALSTVVNGLDHKTPIYGGVEGFAEEISFASGSGYLIDRETLKLIVSHKSKWDNFEIDDVALGKIVQNELNLTITNFERSDIPSASQVNSKKIGISGVFHYRCKANNPSETITIMKHIHERLTHDI